MAVTVNINGLSCVHQTSGGMATATLPDVCRTPYAGTPVPYPNIAMSSDLVAGTVTIAVDGSSAAMQSSMFVKSTGDEAGALGGVVSQVFMMEATFLSFSPTVFFEGQPACRLTDKMLMNKGNTVCMDGVVQPPLPPVVTRAPGAPSQLTPTEPRFCDVQSLRATCAHGRSVDADLGSGIPTLQVVSKASKPDGVLIEWVGSCGFGQPQCPLAAVEMPDGSWDLRAAGTLDVLPPEAWTTSDDALVAGKRMFQAWGDVFRLLMTGQLPHADYLVQGCTCEGGESAAVASGLWLRIQAFPEASTEGQMTISFKHENLKTLKPVKGKVEKAVEAARRDKTGRDVDEAFGSRAPAGAKPVRARAPTMTLAEFSKGERPHEEVEDPLRFEPGSVWSQGGKLTAKLGDDTFELAGDLTVEEGPLNLGSLFRKLGPACVLFERMARWGAPSKFTPRWPNFSMGGGLTLAELPGKPEVGIEGSFSVQAKPLFGLELETSILEFIIRYGGSLGGPAGAVLAQGLLQIREQVAKGVGGKGTRFQASAEIDIVITVGGDIGGGVCFKFLDGEATLDRSVDALHGGVDVIIKGFAKASARVFIVNAAAVAEVGAGGADGKEPARFGIKARPNEHLFDLQAHVYFTGLAIYYVLYVELGASGATNKDEHKIEREDDGLSSPRQTSDPTSKSSGSAKTTDRLYEQQGICVLMKPWTWPEGAAQG
jgi:Toxin PAAR-like domain